MAPLLPCFVETVVLCPSVLLRHCKWRPACPSFQSLSPLLPPRSTLTQNLYKLKMCAIPRVQAWGQLKEINKNQKLLLLHIYEYDRHKGLQTSEFLGFPLSKPHPCLGEPACVRMAWGRQQEGQEESQLESGFEYQWLCRERDFVDLSYSGKSRCCVLFKDEDMFVWCKKRVRKAQTWSRKRVTVTLLIKKQRAGSGEMGQCLIALAALSEVLSSIPSNHMVVHKHL